MARMRRPRPVYCTSRPVRDLKRSPGSVSRRQVRGRTAFAQGPFAPEALPPFTALMGPCADPVASRPPFRLCPYRGRPCRLRHPRLVNGTVPILLCLSVLKCCAPCAGGSPGALDQFFPGDNGLRSTPRARLSSATSHKTASRGWVISARQAFLDVAALQLARPPGRSAPHCSARRLLRSSLLPIRYLLDSRVCYPAD